MSTSSSLNGEFSSPLDVVRQFRQNAVNFHTLWMQTGVPPGV
jgi:hypothetical protein